MRFTSRQTCILRRRGSTSCSFFCLLLFTRAECATSVVSSPPLGRDGAKGSEDLAHTYVDCKGLRADAVSVWGDYEGRAVAVKEESSGCELTKSA
eukprot:6179634-Pleurochrysis_carterae.AAC.1